MNKTKIGKSIVALSTIMSLLTIGGSKVSASIGGCEPLTEDEVKYVNVTMTDINPERYNAKMRGMQPEEYYSKSMEERDNIDKKSMLFGQTEGMTIGGFQNGFIGNNVHTECDGVTQELVEPWLVDGNLRVIDQYNNGTSFFAKPEETGWNKPYNKYLENWQFPFVKQENGYYSFDSEKYHVTQNESKNRFELHKGERHGFYPFNSCSDDTENVSNRNLYFTAKFEIPFYMTTDGKVKNSTTGEYEDMVFNFSGDDDVWVFVDDRLVLDLGGVHIKQTGNINFAKNEVYYSSVYNPYNDSDSFSVYRPAPYDERLSQGKHTLKVFYMERAGGESNLFVSFNLQSSGVETKYVEKYSNKELDSILKTGAVGEKIELEEKQYPDKVICERPNTNNVTLTEDLQTYYFYYKNKYSLNVDYIDVDDGNKIAESVNNKICEDDNYQTEAKEIKGYTLVSEPENKNGVMPHNDLNLVYKYKYSNAKVQVNYIDKITGDILDSQILTGKEGEIVQSEARNFDNYVLVESPKETRYSKKEQTINYYYKHTGKVIVNHIDKARGEKLKVEEKEGIEGDKVKTEPQSFKDYILFKEPEIKEVIINRETKEIDYYYVHQSKIVVNYIDKDTHEKLDVITDTVTEGTVYETKEKEFENYRLVERPEARGILIGKQNVEINYYYEKLRFNLKIEMNLQNANVNDNYHELKNKIGKVETEISEANSKSRCKIFYKIKVTNDEERAAGARIIDYIPDGYMAMIEDNAGWVIAADRMYYDITKIAPNETMEFTVVLTKKDGVDICGTVSNNVKVESLDGVEETRLDDNEDKNDVVIMPRTGVKKIAGLTCLFVIMIVAALRLRNRLKNGKEFKLKFPKLKNKN